MFGTVPCGISAWGRYRKRSPALLFEHDSPETADAATLWNTWFFGVEGTASVTLDDVACEATGALELLGQCSSTLEDVACESLGELEALGFLSSTLEDVTSTATSTLEIAGQLSSALEDVACAGAGDLLIEGSCASSLDDVTCAASSIVADIVHPPTGAVLAVSVLPIRRVTHTAPVRGVAASLPMRTLRRA